MSYKPTSPTHHQQHREHVEEFTSLTSRACGTVETNEGCMQFKVDTTTTQTNERRTNNLKSETTFCLDIRDESFNHVTLDIQDIGARRKC